MGQLVNLKYLNCSSNKIMALPDELGKASALEEMNASDNYLQVSIGLLEVKHSRMSYHSKTYSYQASIPLADVVPAFFPRNSLRFKAAACKP